MPTSRLEWLIAAPWRLAAVVALVVGVPVLVAGEIRAREILLIGLLIAAAYVIARTITDANRRRSALAEALDRETATTKMLQVISRSDFDLDAVLRGILGSAIHLCDADWGTIDRSSGGALSLALQIDGPPAFSQWLEARRSEAGRNPLDGRVLTEMRPIQVTDFQLEYPHERIPRDWFRTVLLVPMLRAGEVIGTICLYRYEAMLTKTTDSGSNTTESAVTIAPAYVQAQHSLIRWSTKLATGARPHPFSEHEITLVQTFADQAALAIENVRLVSETQEKSGMLEIANHELAAASHHKSEFLANMSHELRTPLNAIIGFSDVLEDRMFGELNERQTDYVKDISGSGRHLLDLINEILDLSKVEAGKMDLEPSEFRLADTISSALLLVRERAVRHGIQLSTDVPDDVGMLEADERKLRQVLLNLLSNAVKFTPDGGRIAVTVRRVDPEIRISVRDSGIGIAPEDQPKIFQEFQQVGRPTDRSREGTGLGLTLAKRFVELQGGRIWFESEVGKGTTFTFTLPVRRTAALPA